MRVLEIQGGQCLVENLELADSYWKRLKGLMFRSELPAGSGLLLTGCGRIHTHFMRFDLTVIYMDKDFRVLDTETIRPWRFGKKVKAAANVIEVTAGTVTVPEAGLQLVIL